MSVAKTSAHQTPDLYIFVSIHFENVKKVNGKKLYYGIKNIEILGQAEPEDYFARPMASRVTVSRDKEGSRS